MVPSNKTRNGEEEFSEFHRRNRWRCRPGWSVASSLWWTPPGKRTWRHVRSPSRSDPDAGCFWSAESAISIRRWPTAHAPWNCATSCDGSETKFSPAMIYKTCVLLLLFLINIIKEQSGSRILERRGTVTNGLLPYILKDALK